jgi:pyruvate/2-oxoglutarate/acetoin dehydrogenase E1 component
MKYSKYHRDICNEMIKLSKIEKVLFLGQCVESEDFYSTLTDIPMHQRKEIPVCEELQLGMSIGLAMEGFLPISIFQRMDFLPRACDQIVNHLDLIAKLSRNIFSPKIIIRTTIGSVKPLNCGLQHSKDLSEGFKKLVSFPIFKVETVKEVKSAYKFARECKTSVMIIEDQNLYYD